MNDANGNEIKVGAVVVVGPRYVMGDSLGRGRFEADEWTGRSLRVVALRTSGCHSVALAPANLIGVDESDEIVDISAARINRASK